jgi:hypothetical protein
VMLDPVGFWIAISVFAVIMFVFAVTRPRL